MFDPGFWEVTVIAVLGLLILGPERLPVVAKKVGYWVGKGRRYLSSVRSDIEREFRTDELEKILNQQSTEIEELKDLISDTKKEATDVVQETKELLETSLNTEEKKKPKTNKKKSASKNKLKKEIGKTSTKKDD
ncbi:MAG TPA: twin-arginine translocase subunit TatB, partial [Gammaproteobacteria bacterium]|nr:twin-arginine translocase subunit TatB [Gammaproteobacteria bacterium]